MMSNKGAVMSRLVSPFVDFFIVRGCLHDTGTSFILVPVNPGFTYRSVFVYMILVKNIIPVQLVPV